MFFWMSCILYVGSLWLRVATAEEGIGIMYVLTGWMGLICFCPANWVWCANPALWVSWWTVRHYDAKIARRASLLAAILGTSYLFWSEVARNEGGVPTPIPGYGPGFWCWLGSLFSAMAAAFFLKGTPNPESGTRSVA
jgi:hypothetical protein